MTAIAARRLAPAVVVRAYLDHLAIERGVATNTLASYRRDLNRYLDHLHAASVDSIADVDGQLSHRLPGRPACRG